MTPPTTESAWQATLFISCALPGCVVPVSEPGEVCSSCRSAFGDMLRIHVGVPNIDAEQVAAELRARDESVLAQYRTRTHAPNADAGDVEIRNQICWLCEERRTCTRERDGFECRSCRAANV